MKSLIIICSKLHVILFRENFYQEETYNSEDTESTLSGDLDYELSLNVHLPNNTTQKITISAR